MTKNMTRKGLALGAASALLISGFSALPASSAGLADTSFVRLAPTTGTEYGMNAASGVTFSMTANESTTVSTGDLKFLVTDTSGVIESTTASTLRTVASIAGTADYKVDADGGTAADTARVSFAVAAGHQIAIGDRVSLAVTDGGTNITDAAEVVLEAIHIVTASAAELVSIDVPDAEFGDDIALAAADDADAVITILRSERHATAATYVVDSGVSLASDNETLVLAADAAAVSRSVTVQAWMDANDNNLIDSTEYGSPVRTVTWTKPSEIVVVTTLSPIVGDENLSAVITTTPVLNGHQLLVQDDDFINAKFTRSLSTSAAYGDDDDTSNGEGTVTSIWDDTAKTFTVAVSVDADAAGEATDAVKTSGDGDTWADLASPIAGGTNLKSLAISTTGVVSAVTTNNHIMVSGDKITMNVHADDAAVALAEEAAARTVTVTGPKTFTYTVSETTGLPATAVAATDTTQDTDFVVVTYLTNEGLVDRVGSETYTAQATVLAVLQGNKVTTGVVAAVSVTTTITTAATSTVQGASFAADGGNVVKIAAGTLSVPVTISVTNAAGTSVGAGRAVALAITTEAGTNTYKVNAKTSDTVYTDANGQVSATITSSAGTNAAAVTLKATAENVASAEVDLTWATVAWSLVDLNTTAGTLTAGATTDRDIIKLSSYDMNLMVTDQWFNSASADTYRLKATGEGVTSSFVTLVDGKATITATDTGVFETEMVSVIELQKSTDGVFADAGTYTFDANLSTAYKVNVGAAGNTLYGTAVVASVAVAKKALVEIDQRTAAAVMPAYANKLVLNGSVLESATNAAKVGTFVTVTGPSNVLFSDTADVVQKRGSLTFLTAANGLFEIEAYSTTAQTDTVITFTTSDGATGTIKVSFTGIGVGEGTSLVVTMPAAVKPATTFQVKAMLTDVYGNAVNAAAGSIKVTYTGPGIVYGTLPTTTDSTGGFQFSVLLGSNDTGTVSVTVSYDQNGDTDYVDAKDLTATGTTAITATGVAASETKVNVGSFKGYVALYAKGYKGQKMSAIVAGKWIVVESLASDFERVVRFTGAGYTITTKIYIDGVQIGSEFTTVTK